MRLISQNGMFDVPYENSVIKYDSMDYPDKVKHIIYAHTERHTYGIATYSTESKALKVMEMLRNKYASLELFKTTYQKGVLKSFEKEFGFDEMVNSLTSIFQFPKDEEVEV